MKIYLLIKLLTLHCICAKLSFIELKDIQTTPVLGTENVFVNEDGPLSPTRTHIYNHHGYMHNIRLFSPEITTSYSLKLENMPPTLVCTRTAQNDTAYSLPDVEDKCVENNKHSTCTEQDMSTKNPHYIREYYKTLIQMFPSTAGELAIDVNRDDSFTGFLKEPSVKKYEHYILAALLLLSEGVDVPLAWEKGEKTGAKFLTLRKKYPVTVKQRKFKKKKAESSASNSIETAEEKTDSAEEIILEKDQIIFSVRINIQTAENKKTKKIEYKEAESVINFFIKYKNKDRIEEPASMEEYERGEFLNSAQFLIQSYIHELIDTKLCAQNLIKAAYEILDNKKNELKNKKELQQIEEVDKVIKKCFKKLDSVTEEETVYLDILKKIENIGKDTAFPFRETSQVPTYTRISYYDRKDKAVNDDNKFANCLETALYVLFCSLAYDPKENKYYTEHMGHKVSQDLKEFFEKYPAPVDATTHDMHIDWNRVVADLDDSKDIEYDLKKERNGVESGLLNIFLVIAKVTGRSKLYTKGVGLIKKVQQSTVDIKLCSKLQEYYKEILRSLSRNKSMEIDFKDLKINQKDGRRKDIFGNITLKYTIGEEEYSIKMQANISHSIFSVYSCGIDYTEEEKTKLGCQKDITAKRDSFMGCVFTHYIDKKIQWPTKHKKGADLAKIIENMGDKYPEEINRIFLVNKIEENDYKMQLLMHYIFSAEEKRIKLSKESAVVRFTSNILGSFDLISMALSKACCFVITYINIDPSIYENMHLTEEDCLRMHLFYLPRITSHSVWFLLDANVPQTLVYILKRLINRKNYKVENSPFSDVELAKVIFDCFFESNTMILANEILSAHETKDGEEGALMANLLRITWFIMAYDRKTRNLEMLKELFESIDMTTIFQGDRLCVIVDTPIKKMEGDYYMLHHSLTKNAHWDLQKFQQYFLENGCDPKKLGCIINFLTRYKKLGRI